MMETRAFESGDKVWFGGGAVKYDAVDFRFVRPLCDVFQILGDQVDYPAGKVFQAAVSSDGTGWWIPEDRLTLLPPWIDEPHPLGEIQRVFAELHGEEL